MTDFDSDFIRAAQDAERAAQALARSADKLREFFAGQRVVSEREMAQRERDQQAMARDMRGDPT